VRQAALCPLPRTLGPDGNSRKSKSVVVRNASLLGRDQTAGSRACPGFASWLRNSDGQRAWLPLYDRLRRVSSLSKLNACWSCRLHRFAANHQVKSQVPGRRLRPMIKAAFSASALRPHLPRSSPARSLGSVIHRRWPNPSVKGTNCGEPHFAPYVER
jgi:hypothetical protein